LGIDLLSLVVDESLRTAEFSVVGTIETGHKPMALKGSLLVYCDEERETIIHNCTTGEFAVLHDESDGEAVPNVSIPSVDRLCRVFDGIADSQQMCTSFVQS
jgi:hypothetical protein